MWTARWISDWYANQPKSAKRAPLTIQPVHKLRIDHRYGHRLVRLVLTWFMLSIGVAIASPLVNPQEMQLICTAGAFKLLIKNADGTEQTTGHKLDCPMCATLAAPPPEAVQLVPPLYPLAYATQPIPAARIAALVGAPLPARGPPTL